MRFPRDVAILAALMALGTWLLGWWAVPLVAAFAAALARHRRGLVTRATLAAPLAWGALLVLQRLFGTSVSQLGRDLADSLGVPPLAPIVLTLVLPAILAAAAAGAVMAARRPAPSPPAPTGS
jgi:hypothetical protein